MRQRAPVAAFLVVALLAIPTQPARAAQQAVVTFNGELTFFANPSRTGPTAPLWSPLSPGCAGLTCPGQELWWELSTSTGPLGQRLCAFVAHPAGWPAFGVHTDGLDAGQPCSVSGDGNLHSPTLRDVGAWCEFSQGSISHLTITVNGVVTSLLGLSVVHAGRLHLWALFDEWATQLPVGVAVMEFVHDGALGVDGNACGLNPLTDFRGSSTMKVNVTLGLALP